MELRQITSVLFKWWWLLLASAVVAGVSAYFGSKSTPRMYMAHTTLMVGQVLQNPNPSSTEFYTGQVLAQSYADLARREPVLRATLEALGLNWDWEALKGMVTSRVIQGTQLLEISVVDGDPQRARVLAEEVAHQLILQSPAGADQETGAEQQFITSQIEELKTNIKNSQEEVRQLDDVIAKANSARQIQDARSRQAALQTQISSWQATYAQLLTYLRQGSTNVLSVVEPAQTPYQPIGSRAAYNVLLAMAIGLVLSGSAAFLLEYIDDSLKTADDVRHALGLKVLGSITRIQGDDYEDKLVVSKYPRSPTAEAFRVLRTNLQFSAERSWRTLMVTSASPLEGKSLTTANLAAAVAQSGQRVILVDADLRRPTQHHIFGLENQVGLSDVLEHSEVSLSEVLQTVSVANLSVVTSGPLPENPSELLGSKRMGDLMELLQQSADVVIFDSPPVMAVADAAILASRLDGVLLVIDAGTTRRGAARRSKESLDAVGGHLLGVTLNRLSASRSGGYYYYYYSSDGRRRKRRSPRDLLARVFGRNGHSAGETSRSSVSVKEATSQRDKTTEQPSRTDER